MRRKKILWIGDAVVPTGFSTVNTNIIKNLSKVKYEINQLGINYFGDPHSHNWKIYPAVTGGDIYGLKRLESLNHLKPDVIFILNDPWMVTRYLEVIEKHFNPIPKIVVYFPIDSLDYDYFHFEHWEKVTVPVAYTQFGYKQLKSARPELEVKVINHGVDQKSFYKISEERTPIRQKVFNNDPVLSQEDTFIVLNANRNQPRKRIDLTIEGFANFAADKPENVRLYLHMGLKDAGWDIVRLALRYGVDKRIILTSLEPKNLTVPIESLNQIYNACNVGINTSSGEGWGLVSMEHAITGALQIVPDHSACKELFSGCGLLLPAGQTIVEPSSMTKHSLISPDDVAQKLEIAYTDHELNAALTEAAINKFTSSDYSWKQIAKEWDEIFESL